MTTATRPALIDPVLREKVWAHSGAGRYYVPQSLTGYLLGRALDAVIVTAVTAGLTMASSALLETTAVMASEWGPIVLFGVLLFLTVFLTVASPAQSAPSGP